MQQYLTGRWCQLCTHITGSFCFVLTWIQFKELCHGWQVICLSQNNPKQYLFLCVWYYLFNVFLLVMVNFHVEVSIILKVALSITKIVQYAIGSIIYSFNNLEQFHITEQCNWPQYWIDSYSLTNACRPLIWNK